MLSDLFWLIQHGSSTREKNRLSESEEALNEYLELTGKELSVAEKGKILENYYKNGC
jgi:hypothetical protein